MELIRGDVVVTDFYAATTWHQMKNSAKAATLCVFVAGVGLAGCEGSGNILGSAQIANPVQTAQQAPVAPQSLGAIALAPIIGPPEAIGNQLRASVEQASLAKQITILPDRDPKANYGMRGYIVAARDRGAIKVSYIWDVTDQAGKRINRITGEEMAQAPAGSKDPWAAITPAVSQAVASKVASSLAQWLPSQSSGPAVAAASTPIASASGTGAGSIASASAPATTNATTASLQPVSAAPTATVPAAPVVTGAPGDGNQALASALSRELSRQGVSLANAQGQYRVEGTVAMGTVQDGKQSIRIDWRVKDAKGAAVGTVTQKNAIPPGSLDQQWGQTADAAAAAAAQGIIKLLPKGTASGNG